MEKERVSGPIDGWSKLQIDRLATFVTGGETEEAEPALATAACCGGKTGGGRKSALVNRAPAAVRRPLRLREGRQSGWARFLKAADNVTLQEINEASTRNEVSDESETSVNIGVCRKRAENLPSLSGPPLTL